jgi:hypothetical protein
VNTIKLLSLRDSCHVYACIDPTYNAAFSIDARTR